MSVNFYETNCRSTTNKRLFGLCDNEDNSPAFIDFVNKSQWNALVINSAPPQEIIFVAIDNCIEIRRKNGEMDNRCDCLLTYPENIIFIELKNKGAQWITEGIDQIVATINNFNESHGLSQFGHKRAFVANKKHPNFRVIDTETKRKFWDNYKVRLNIDSVIKI